MIWTPACTTATPFLRLGTDDLLLDLKTVGRLSTNPLDERHWASARCRPGDGVATLSLVPSPLGPISAALHRMESRLILRWDHVHPPTIACAMAGRADDGLVSIHDV